jgi:hypothetical protein
MRMESWTIGRYLKPKFGLRIILRHLSTCTRLRLRNTCDEFVITEPNQAFGTTRMHSGGCANNLASRSRGECRILSSIIWMSRRDEMPPIFYDTQKSIFALLMLCIGRRSSLMLICTALAAPWLVAYTQSDNRKQSRQMGKGCLSQCQRLLAGCCVDER